MRSTIRQMLTRIVPLAVAVLLAACATTPPAPPAVEKGELENAADGTVIAIKRGGELKVLLDANITTGYQWQGPAAVAPVLSAIGNPIYVSKSSESRYTGGGGVNVFRFKAEQPGSTTLRFDYKRAWEANVAPVKTVRYTVYVAP